MSVNFKSQFKGIYNNAGIFGYVEFQCHWGSQRARKQFVCVLLNFRSEIWANDFYLGVRTTHVELEVLDGMGWPKDSVRNKLVDLDSTFKGWEQTEPQKRV